ncbi:alpha/beta hydrolase [Actinomycetospora sp. OC33-EN08]|uniref:Alpha/beta hydrolase n=1 Tax=Actinomycetospora aurantiaca TaxID=3129233 RepID=A0ABU8MLA6_9PSEU
MDRRVRLLGRAMRRTASISSMSPQDIERAQQQGAPPAVLGRLFGRRRRGVEVDDRVVDLPGGRRRLRVYRPSAASRENRPVVVNFHGGGWVLGSVEGGDWLCSNVAADVDAVVVSVDYRLAPADRFPVAVEDCYEATSWVAEHADELGGDAGPLAVMGDSAGGNLAAVVSLLARDRSGPAIASQILIYPATDLTLSSPSLTSNADQPVLSTDEVRAFRGHYLGDDASAARDPRASPLLATDHAGLPPALVQVAEHDPIRDDGSRYAEALRAAGVPVRFTEYVGMPHGYLSLPGVCRSAPQALHEVVTELRDRLVVHPRPR